MSNLDDDSNVLDTPPSPTGINMPSAESEMTPDLPADAIDFQNGTNAIDVTSSISGSQEKTRAKIAWTFTQIFLLLVIGALTLPFISNLWQPGAFADPVEASKNLLTIVASILGGPFGFIVGFYFKQVNEQ